jgi:hypothetical protein
LKTSDLDPAGIVAAWNSLYPVGTPVQVWRLDLPNATGVTSGPAEIGDRLGRPVVRVSCEPDPVLLTCVTVVREYVHACDVCGEPEEGHGIRYAAIRGHHEWTDPDGRSVAYVPDPARAAAPPECDCPPGRFCAICDPWENDPPAAAASEPTVQPDPARPSLLARIFHAPKKKEDMTR